MKILPVRNILYNKTINYRGTDKTTPVKNNNKAENPYKDRNVFLGFIAGFLVAYGLLVLSIFPKPKI